MTRQYWQGATVEVQKIPSADIQRDKPVLEKGWALKLSEIDCLCPEILKLFDLCWDFRSTVLGKVDANISYRLIQI